MLRVVIVNLRSDSDFVFRGALWGSRGPWLTLRDVTLLRTSGEATRMPGEIVVHRSNVSFLQVVP